MHDWGRAQATSHVDAAHVDASHVDAEVHGATRERGGRNAASVTTGKTTNRAACHRGYAARDARRNARESAHRRKRWRTDRAGAAETSHI